MELKDLIHKRDEKLDAMDALMVPVKDKDGNDTEQRSCPEDKQPEWRTLKGEVDKLNRQIAQRKEEDEVQKQITERSMRNNPAPAVHTREHKFDISKAIRQADKLDGLEKEVSDENASKRGISSNGLLLTYRQVNELFGVEKRAAVSVDSTAYANITPTVLDNTLSIIDYQTILEKLGVTRLTGLRGVHQLHYSDPQTGQNPAESVAFTAAGQSPSKKTLSPSRVGWMDVFTKESLALASPELHQAIIMDAVKTINKKLEAMAMVELGTLTAKTGYVGGTDTDAALARVNLTEFEGALKDPSNAKYVTNRVIYSGMRDVKVDTGSGRFLVEGKAAEGQTHTGMPIFSTGFMTNTKDIILGDFSELFVGDWGVVEILNNPYTYDETGQIKITINQLLDVAVRNPAAFVRASNVVM